MKLFLQDYLLLTLLTLLTLFSCVEKGTTDSNNPSTLSIDYGISEDFYIALTNTRLELIQKGNFGSQSNFFVSPSLPSGLSLDITNGNISGTPTTVSLPTPYTITATKDSKTYTKAISLGAAPSIAWVTPVSSNYLKAYVVGDGSKQISDWTWGSSDESLLTVVNGLVNLSPTATGGNSAIIYAKKDTSSGSAQASYSNGISIPLADVGVGKTITMGTSIHLIINSGTTGVTTNQFNNQGLTSVVIPDSVTHIGNNAFLQNLLTRVDIPNSVTTIGGSAFALNQLTSVIIPNSVTTINTASFNQNQLTSVVIPNSITYIGNHAFSDNQLTNLVIPNSVTNINSSAFFNNRLTSLTIANSVTSIGYAAFSYNLLTNLVIPNSVTSIGESAFGDNRLTTVVIGNSVTYIGSHAFNPNQLTRVVIPDSVTNIGGSAFLLNPNLVQVSLKQSLYTKITNTSSTNTVFGTQVTNYIRRP